MKPDIKFCSKCESLSEYGSDRELFCLKSHKQKLDSNGYMQHTYTRILAEHFEVPEDCPYRLEFMIK